MNITIYAYKLPFFLAQGIVQFVDVDGLNNSAPTDLRTRLLQKTPENMTSMAKWSYMKNRGFAVLNICKNVVVDDYIQVVRVSRSRRLRGSVRSKAFIMKSAFIARFIFFQKQNSLAVGRVFQKTDCLSHLAIYTAQWSPSAPVCRTNFYTWGLKAEFRLNENSLNFKLPLTIIAAPPLRISSVR